MQTCRYAYDQEGVRELFRQRSSSHNDMIDNLPPIQRNQGIAGADQQLFCFNLLCFKLPCFK